MEVHGDEASLVSELVDTMDVVVPDEDPERTEIEFEPVVAPPDADDGDGWIDSVERRLVAVHPAAWCVLAGAIVFAIVFGRLGVQHHRNFGTWSFDMGIYDQGFWLISHGKSWNTVRGIDMWGHHVNLIALAYAPFYWLGAGPSFLYVSQAIALGAGAIPVYLIATDRLKSPWYAMVFAFAYLMYAPIQWISWANFHPEALVITPMLFAWWFAIRRNWGWCFGAVAVALSTREDTALAIFMMGLVLLALMWRRSDATRHDRRMAMVVSAMGVVWYLICMRLVIPHFNRGQQPFYIDYFYGNYGSSTTEIVGEMLKRPDRVASDATQPDRLRFYRDLLLPWGGLPLGGPLQLTMALPQMLASVIGLSPYARMIRYQYTSIMIAPIVIAAIEGGALAMRYRVGRWIVLPWLAVCMYVSNVAWSPSPLGANYDVAWAQPSARHDLIREAMKLIPDDASVTATYGILPHLSHREQIYDWPNPWKMAYFGNDDGYRLPDPSEIEYIILDRRNVGDAEQPLVDSLIAPGGEFEVLFDQDDLLVGHRVHNA
jgi:uncharacterized membrane protein